MKRTLIVGLCFLTLSCASSKKVSKPTLVNNNRFLLKEISKDSTYGYTSDNAVQVGGNENHEGPVNERRFLNALAGPNGEEVSYYRAGSCCPTPSKKGLFGTAILDKYRVTWEGSKDTVTIYINMYDYSELKAPVGFTIKN